MSGNGNHAVLYGNVVRARGVQNELDGAFEFYGLVYEKDGGDLGLGDAFHCMYVCMYVCMYWVPKFVPTTYNWLVTKK